MEWLLFVDCFCEIIDQKYEGGREIGRRRQWHGEGLWSALDLGTTSNQVL